mgnify:CR=1 FL=1
MSKVFGVCGLFDENAACYVLRSLVVSDMRMRGRL